MGSNIAKSNPQLVENVTRASETGLRLVSSTLPRLAEAARQTGRSVKSSVSGMASSAGEVMQQALPTGSTAKATGLALASAAALQAAQRGVVRLAMRRPLLFAVGGLAIVGGLVLASRRRASGKHEAAASGGEGIGEGSYAGARDYHDRTSAFLQSQGKRVTARARQATKALESGERAELEAAEAKGRRHARS